MKFLPIVFLLTVVCLAVAAGEAPHPKPKPPGPPTTTTTTTSTVRTTTTPVTTTTVRPKKTRKPKISDLTTTTTTTATTSSPSPSNTVNPTTQPTTTTAPPTVTCTAVVNSAISESPCGTCTPLTPTSGTIQSLNFPKDYGVYLLKTSYIDCLYTMKASPGSKIQLTFSKFIVDKNNDFVTVYDGMAPNGTILADSLTGYVLPPAPFTTVTNNQMAVVFKTDKSNAGLPLNLRPAGWQANYTIVPASAATTTTKLPETTTSQPTTSTTTSTAVPPTTSTTSAATTTTKVPETTTSQPTTSTRATTSSTRPSPTTTVNPTTQPTTTTVPPTVTCTAVATTTVSQTPCGTCTMLTPTSGTIQSLHFPEDYGVYFPNTSTINCLYTITTSLGWKIRLTFTTFIVEQSFDLITIYDGIAPKGTILADSLTGYDLPTNPFTTVTNNQMALTFNTDKNNNAVPLNLMPAKWQATFTVVPASTEQTTTSTAVPSTTPTTSAATTTQVTTTTISEQTTTTTSSTRPSPTTTVNPTTQPTTTTVPTTLTCTAVATTTVSLSPCGTCTPLTSKSGTIESLNFPNDYGVYNSSDAYINCLYTIKAPPGKKIKLTFINKFVVEKDKDFITIIDGMAPNGTILADSLTGYTLPTNPFTTVTTNQMAVIFNTDRNNIGLALRFRPACWQANYKVVP